MEDKIKKAINAFYEVNGYDEPEWFDDVVVVFDDEEGVYRFAVCEWKRVDGTFLFETGTPRNTILSKAEEAMGEFVIAHLDDEANVSLIVDHLILIIMSDNRALVRLERNYGKAD